MLPVEVLEQTQRDTLNYNGTGMSVMEMSHRSKAFDGIIKQAEADLRTLLSIPDNYKVLFVQGGASTQFAAIPLNFTQEGEQFLLPCHRALLCASSCWLSSQAPITSRPPCLQEGGGCPCSSCQSLRQINVARALLIP